MNKQRILWFQDGVKFTTPIDMWARIDDLTQDLIRVAGNRDFDHVIIDPVSCAKELFRQINLNDFSCVVDLSGFLGKIPREAFPTLPVVDNFRLSGLRTVSSPRLDGSGFLVSLNNEQVKGLRDSVDLSKPLFLDDVAWSGRTISAAVKVLGVNPMSTTVGLLVSNNGSFGKGKPGALSMLEEEGMQVLFGESVFTPQDDGFHLEDFFNFLPNEAVFDDILKIWEMRTKMQNLSGEAKQNTENEIKNILMSNKDALFPKAVSSEEMKLLQQEGRLYQYQWHKQKFNV